MTFWAPATGSLGAEFEHMHAGTRLSQKAAPVRVLCNMGSLPNHLILLLLLTLRAGGVAVAPVSPPRVLILGYVMWVCVYACELIGCARACMQTCARVFRGHPPTHPSATPPGVLGASAAPWPPIFIYARLSSTSSLLDGTQNEDTVPCRKCSPSPPKHW